MIAAGAVNCQSMRRAGILYSRRAKGRIFFRFSHQTQNGTSTRNSQRFLSDVVSIFVNNVHSAHFQAVCCVRGCHSSTHSKNRFFVKSGFSPERAHGKMTCVETKKCRRYIYVCNEIVTLNETTSARGFIILNTLLN